MYWLKPFKTVFFFLLTSLYDLIQILESPETSRYLMTQKKHFFASCFSIFLVKLTRSEKERMQRGNLRVTLCKLFCSLAALINAQFREQTDVQAPATKIKSLGTSNKNRQTLFPIAHINAWLAFKLVDPVCTNSSLTMCLKCIIIMWIQRDSKSGDTVLPTNVGFKKYDSVYFRMLKKSKNLNLIIWQNTTIHTQNKV